MRVSHILHLPPCAIFHINKYILLDIRCKVSFGSADPGLFPIPSLWHEAGMCVIPRKLCCCFRIILVLHFQSLLPCYPYISYSWNNWDAELELLLLRRDPAASKNNSRGFHSWAGECWRPLGMLEALGNAGGFWECWSLEPALPGGSHTLLKALLMAFN